MGAVGLGAVGLGENSAWVLVTRQDLYVWNSLRNVELSTAVHVRVAAFRRKTETITTDNRVLDEINNEFTHPDAHVTRGVKTEDVVDQGIIDDTANQGLPSTELKIATNPYALLDDSLDEIDLDKETVLVSDVETDYCYSLVPFI